MIIASDMERLQGAVSRAKGESPGACEQEADGSNRDPEANTKGDRLGFVFWRQGKKQLVVLTTIQGLFAQCRVVLCLTLECRREGDSTLVNDSVNSRSSQDMLQV